MLRSLLNLKNAVQIRRITEANDGMGGLSSSTALTTLSRASIWQPGSGDATISDKVTKTSTHVLACLTGEYTFTDADSHAIYNGATYRLTGHADDIANRGEITIIGLERLS